MKEMKKESEDKSSSRSNPKEADRKDRPGSPRVFARPDTGGLARSGLYSLLLHMVLIAFLMVSLKAGGTKGGPSVYRVTLRPFSGPGSGAPPGGPAAGSQGGAATAPSVAKAKTIEATPPVKPVESAKTKVEKSKASLSPEKRKASEPRAAEEKVTGLKKSSKKVETPEKEKTNKSLEDALAEIRRRAALDEIQRKVALRGREKPGTEVSKEGQTGTAPPSGAVDSSGKSGSVPGLGPGTGSGTGTGAGTGAGTGTGTGTGTGAGGLSGGGSPWGSSLLEAKLNDYYSTIWAMIKKEWSLPENLPKGKTDLETVIVVIIEKDGSVQKSWFEKKSGNTLYDQMAMRAIKKAEPFPPIPKELGDNPFELGIRFYPE
jgi:TonB family protein